MASGAWREEKGTPKKDDSSLITSVQIVNKVAINIHLSGFHEHCTVGDHPPKPNGGFQIHPSLIVDSCNGAGLSKQANHVNVYVNTVPYSTNGGVPGNLRYVN